MGQYKLQVEIICLLIKENFFSPQWFAWFSLLTRAIGLGC